MDIQAIADVDNRDAIRVDPYVSGTTNKWLSGIRVAANFEAEPVCPSFSGHSVKIFPRGLDEDTSCGIGRKQRVKICEYRSSDPKNALAQISSSDASRSGNGIHDVSENIKVGCGDKNLRVYTLPISQSLKYGKFSVDGYYEMYPDVKNAGVGAIDHYVYSGYKEGRLAKLETGEIGTFYAAGYYEMYPDVKKAGVDALEHYRSDGYKEGRKFCIMSSSEQKNMNNAYHIIFPSAACPTWAPAVVSPLKEGIASRGKSWYQLCGQTVSDVLDCCMNRKSGGYCNAEQHSQSATCDNFMSEYCKHNRDAPECACMVQKSDKPDPRFKDFNVSESSPMCSDPQCFRNPTTTYRTRSIQAQQCPPINLCEFKTGDIKFMENSYANTINVNCENQQSTSSGNNTSGNNTGYNTAPPTTPHPNANPDNNNNDNKSNKNVILVSVSILILIIMIMVSMI
jgi:hypothetical protein